jgi:hypothetical protein
VAFDQVVPERVPSFSRAARISFLKARILSLSVKPATLPSKHGSRQERRVANASSSFSSPTDSRILIRRQLFFAAKLARTLGPKIDM